MLRMTATQRVGWEASVNTGMIWHPASNTDAAQLGVGNQR